MSNEKMKKRIFIALVLVIVAALSIAAFSRHAYVVPVLMYHSIDYNDKMTKLSVSPESFERQMEFFYRNHYNIVPLNKIIPYIKKKARVPPKTAAITFDDGYYNNYKYAYPVLKKYNIPYIKQCPIEGMALVDFLLPNKIIILSK